MLANQVTNEHNETKSDKKSKNAQGQYVVGYENQEQIKQLETPAELASRIGVSVSTIRYLIKTHQLDHIFLTPAKRNPKIPAGAWDKYIQANTIGPTAQ